MNLTAIIIIIIIIIRNSTIDGAYLLSTYKLRRAEVTLI